MGSKIYPSRISLNAIGKPFSSYLSWRVILTQALRIFFTNLALFLAFGSLIGIFFGVAIGDVVERLFLFVSDGAQLVFEIFVFLFFLILTKLSYAIFVTAIRIHFLCEDFSAQVKRNISAYLEYKIPVEYFCESESRFGHDNRDVRLLHNAFVDFAEDSSQALAARLEVMRVVGALSATFDYDYLGNFFHLAAHAEALRTMRLN